MSQDGAVTVGEAQLRSRVGKDSKNKDAQNVEPEESIKEKVMRMNMEQPEEGKTRKMFGRTPDGKSEFYYQKKSLKTMVKNGSRRNELTNLPVFTVPETHDMVSQLLSPSQPKNASDVVVLAILGLHIAALFYLPNGWRIPMLGMAFLFWRGCYNADSIR